MFIIQAIRIALVATLILFLCWPLYLVVGYQWDYEKWSGKKMKHARGSAGMAELFSTISICFFITVVSYLAVAWLFLINP